MATDYDFEIMLNSDPYRKYNVHAELLYAHFIDLETVSIIAIFKYGPKYGYDFFKDYQFVEYDIDAVVITQCLFNKVSSRLLSEIDGGEVMYLFPKDQKNEFFRFEDSIIGVFEFNIKPEETEFERMLEI